MTGDKNTEPKVYIIPEVRERTLFDVIAEKVVPQIFVFAEYCAVAGFFLYVGIKQKSTLPTAFGMLLYACVYWHFMHKLIEFIKPLKFKTLWGMRLAYWSTIIIGVSLIACVQMVILQIAAVQAAS